MTHLDKINLSEPEEEEHVKAYFSGLHAQFEKEAFSPDDGPIPCLIHKVFTPKSKKDEHCLSHHNCIGCNLADQVLLIENFLRAHETQYRIQFSFTTYIILCYLLVERMDTILNIIQIHDEIRAEDFKILNLIRKWANFIKHPKAFVLTHHAAFTHPGSPAFEALRDAALLKIDRDFVFRWWTEADEKKDKELFSELENRDSVLVIFPDLKETTTALCSAMNKFNALFEKNDAFVRLLKNRSTFLHYWDVVAPGG